jgi:hypothetical protein
MRTPRPPCPILLLSRLLGHTHPQNFIPAGLCCFCYSLTRFLAFAPVTMRWAALPGLAAVALAPASTPVPATTVPASTAAPSCTRPAYWPLARGNFSWFRAGGIVAVVLLQALEAHAGLSALYHEFLWHALALALA